MKTDYRTKHTFLFIPAVLYLAFPRSLVDKRWHINEEEFPKRVEQYEPILVKDGFYFLAPLPGIVNLHDKENYIWELKVSGKYITGAGKDTQGFKEKKFSRMEKKEWLEFLNAKGLYSFEYGKTLSHLLEPADFSQVIFLLQDAYYPSFWRDQFRNYDEEIEALKEWWKVLFPGVEAKFLPSSKDIRNFFSTSKSYTYHYKYLKYKWRNSLIFSPATTYALIRAIFYDEPFTKNFFVFHDYEKEKIYVYYLYHGTLFKDLVNSHEVNSHNWNTSGEMYFDIYSDYYVFYKPKEKYNLCTGCFACNKVCPVEANPMSLWENPVYFRKDICIGCGLCEESCESNLPLLNRIHEISV